jgi:nuclear pore complex protein Nup93
MKVLNHALADAISIDLGETPLYLEPLKPRQSDPDNSSPSTVQSGPVSSLSLTQSSSSPAELARNMKSLYDSNAAYFNKITPENRQTGEVLLRLLIARQHLESNPPRFMTALEEINDIGLIPLRANGSIPLIRNSASMFGTLPPLVSRCLGVSIVWAVRAIGGERDKIIRLGSWETGFGGDKDALKEQLGSMAKDLMVFAGLVKYKLPTRVFDMLTRVGGEVGSY